MKLNIESEYGPLKKVIVHIPGAEHERSVPWDGAHPFLLDDALSVPELQFAHEALHSFLSHEIGADNVLTVRHLLTDIFESVDGAQRKKILEDILETKNFEEYQAYIQGIGFSIEDYPASEIVSELIEGCPRIWEVVHGEVARQIIRPKRSLMWTRDSAAATPTGIIISSMARKARKGEPALMRAIFKYHPQFGDYNIILDLLGLQREMAEDPSLMLAWDYILEGGNLLVLSDEVLAIGVGKQNYEYGKRTNRRAFELLVKRLFQANKDRSIQRIYLVTLPDLHGFIHLDTVFNMFGPKSAIAMPYVFGYPDTFEKAFSPLIKRIRQDLAEEKTDLSKIPSLDDFEHAGKVEIYTRETFERSGEVERLKVSKYFLEQLEEDGILDLNNVVWVGGNPEDHPNRIEHLRVALREQINQAGNVFTVKPFRSIAYHRNPFTLAALEAKMKSLSSDAHLERMPSNELVKHGGGPHCLTMPLVRM